ncbi:bifunctional ADP-dependent NAD(P)H-hydrate dehydratase/NAD(P)H-hydrate epimerase [Arcanobacterium canis]
MDRSYLPHDVVVAEKPLLDAGEPLMALASFACAQAVIADLHRRGARVSGSTILVLAGRGNNGGDALFAGAALARRGAQVRIAHCPGAHREGLAAALANGARAYEIGDSPSDCARLRDLAAWGRTWIDGLLGIGSTGAARAPISTWIEVLTHERVISPDEPRVVAVDVPSGVDVATGRVPGPVLRADVTVAMGVRKPAHLLPPTSSYCGRIVDVPLGIESSLPHPPYVCSLSDADVADMWMIPGEHDHKYTRGVLGMLTGSDRYPGAALLGIAGALAVGPGMVRYVGSVDVTSRFPEIVTESGRVQAWVIGSGLDVFDDARQILRNARADFLPVVLDAGAVALAAEEDLPEVTVLTPHAGELSSLLGQLGEPMSRRDIEAQPMEAARLAAEKTGAIVVAKGNVDVIVPPTGVSYAQGGAPGWRAVAGAGDTYAGMIGGLLAGLSPSRENAAWGAAAASHIHARAALRASHAAGRIGHPIRAYEIAGAISDVIDAILNGES